MPWQLPSRAKKRSKVAWEYLHREWQNVFHGLKAKPVEINKKVEYSRAKAKRTHNVRTRKDLYSAR